MKIGNKWKDFIFIIRESRWEYIFIYMLLVKLGDDSCL